MVKIGGRFVLTVALLVIGAVLLDFGDALWPHSPLFAAQPPLTSPVPGALEGRVIFRGAAIPTPTEIENTTDPQFCGVRRSCDDFLISKKNRGIQNVILSVGNKDLPLASPGKAEKLVLENRDCRFQPHAAVLTTGGTVEAVNLDSIFHTTHFYYSGTSRNLSLPVGGKASQTLSRPGLVLVRCDIHGWMKAYIRVDTHPFHAVSDADGKFQIRDIPPGDYTLEVWHEELGEQKLSVTIQAGKTETLEISYPAQIEKER